MNAHPAPVNLALGPELTIAFAAAGRDTLLQALTDAPGDLQLDLGGVTEMDSAGLQLLLSTQRSLAQRGQRLHVTASSPAVDAALATFGLAPPWHNAAA